MYKLACVICLRRFELDQYYDVCSLKCEQTRLGLTPDTTKNIIAYGRALVSAQRAFDALEPRAGRVEKLLIKVLRASYQNRLKHLLLVLPSETSEAILNPDRADTGTKSRSGLSGEDLNFELDMRDADDDGHNRI